MRVTGMDQGYFLLLEPDVDEGDGAGDHDDHDSDGHSNDEHGSHVQGDGDRGGR